MVSGCSSFSCGLCRLVNNVGPSVGIVEGSRVDITRVGTLTPRCVILSPKPGSPGSTNIYISITQRLNRCSGVLNIYLNRRSVYRTFNTGVACTGGLVRNGRDLYEISGGSLLFGKLPSRVRITHCRSLTTSRDAVPSYLEMATGANSNRVVTTRRYDLPVCKLRFRPRSVLAPYNRTVVGGFLKKRSGSWKIAFGNYNGTKFGL